MIAVIRLGQKEWGEHLTKALDYLGLAYNVTKDAYEIRKAERIILHSELPFDETMYALHLFELHLLIKQEARVKPFLGIGSGMKVLFTSSDERGYYQGLNVLNGHITASADQGPDQKRKGWNWVSFRHPYPLLEEVEEGLAYYHDFAPISDSNPEDVLAYSSFQQDIPAMVEASHLGHTVLSRTQWKAGIAVIRTVWKDIARERVGFGGNHA